MLFSLRSPFSDWAYNGFYYPDDDSKGFNYHQGPVAEYCGRKTAFRESFRCLQEWVWQMGYFLRAKLVTARRLRSGDAEIWPRVVREVKGALGEHWDYLKKSPWRSLPELTNKVCQVALSFNFPLPMFPSFQDGAHCDASCLAQAWSVGCILEVLQLLAQQ